MQARITFPCWNLCSRGKFIVTKQTTPIIGWNQSMFNNYNMDNRRLGICYTGSIGWRTTDPSIHSNTESTLSRWMTKPALPVWRLGYPQIQAFSTDNSPIHSDRYNFILIRGTYLGFLNSTFHKGLQVYQFWDFSYCHYFWSHAWIGTPAAGEKQTYHIK